ncbi:hypothetical protein NDU88_004870 [Pleurodeles waltl]|uniref:Uncharacterized protein n=1 Tax=Pleurodeles waltl TaxID=8319 RepID=A0AAV7WX31_PLEWA|nr:hypothetical protein NDU88_004870 [Pleurodeles waltl]
MQPLTVPPAVTVPTQGPPDLSGAPGLQGHPPCPPTRGPRFSAPDAQDRSGPSSVRAAASTGRTPARASPRVPGSSPGAAGFSVRRPSSDPHGRVQTGLRGSPAGPLWHPPQYQHRWSRGRLAIFR